MGKCTTIEERTITYFIDEENKTVKAVIKDVENDAINTLVKIYGSIDLVKYLFDSQKKNIDKLLMHNTYSGVAKCLPIDKFDIEKGKAIARKIAIVKYNKAKGKRLIMFKNRVVRFNNRLDDEIRYAKSKKENINNDVLVLQGK